MLFLTQGYDSVSCVSSYSIHIFQLFELKNYFEHSKFPQSKTLMIKLQTSAYNPQAGKPQKSEKSQPQMASPVNLFCSPTFAKDRLTPAQPNRSNNCIKGISCQPRLTLPSESLREPDFGLCLLPV